MKKATQFTHSGRPKAELGTPVSLPLTRASTLLFERAEDLYRNDIRGYGRHGTSVHDALAQMFTDLEGGAGSVLFPSGLLACTIPILALAKAGDHILLTDSAYGPTRAFCQNHLAKFGIETELYDPHIGAGIEAFIRENTRLILLESPGSLTLDVQDVPAITKVARTRGVTTLLDNTWSAGLVFNAIEKGVDISCHAATKYFGGHSDILFGAAIAASDVLHRKIAMTAKYLGNASSPDDAYQILRGFRTVVPRFEAQARSALEIATWLGKRPEIETVLHVALPSHPDHALWKRDFTGAAPLFSVVLKPVPAAKVLAFVNALKLFGIGYSYGGFESLCIHCDPQLKRAKSAPQPGPLVRFAIGLEDTEDLKYDIEQALAALF